MNESEKISFYIQIISKSDFENNINNSEMLISDINIERACKALDNTVKNIFDSLEDSFNW